MRLQRLSVYFLLTAAISAFGFIATQPLQAADRDQKMGQAAQSRRHATLVGKASAYLKDERGFSEREADRLVDALNTPTYREQLARHEDMFIRVWGDFMRDGAAAQEGEDKEKCAEDHLRALQHFSRDLFLLNKVPQKQRDDLIASKFGRGSSLVPNELREKLIGMSHKDREEAVVTWASRHRGSAAREDEEDGDAKAAAATEGMTRGPLAKLLDVHKLVVEFGLNLDILTLIFEYDSDTASWMGTALEPIASVLWSEDSAAYKPFAHATKLYGDGPTLTAQEMSLQHSDAICRALQRHTFQSRTVHHSDASASIATIKNPLVWDNKKLPSDAAKLSCYDYANAAWSLGGPSSVKVMSSTGDPDDCLEAGNHFEEFRYAGDHACMTVLGDISNPWYLCGQHLRDDQYISLYPGHIGGATSVFDDQCSKFIGRMWNRETSEKGMVIVSIPQPRLIDAEDTSQETPKILFFGDEEFGKLYPLHLTANPDEVVAWNVTTRSRCVLNARLRKLTKIERFERVDKPIAPWSSWTSHTPAYVIQNGYRQITGLDPRARNGKFVVRRLALNPEQLIGVGFKWADGSTVPSSMLAMNYDKTTHIAQPIIYPLVQDKATGGLIPDISEFVKTFTHKRDPVLIGQSIDDRPRQPSRPVAQSWFGEVVTRVTAERRAAVRRSQQPFLSLMETLQQTSGLGEATAAAPARRGRPTWLTKIAIEAKWKQLLSFKARLTHAFVAAQLQRTSAGVTPLKPLC